MTSGVEESIGGNDLIVYCEDIDREYPTAIFFRRTVFTDRVYLGYQDEDLMDLFELEIHKIQNIYFIQQI